MLLAGKRLIDHATSAASHWSDDVRIALRKPGQLPDGGIPTLIDDPGTAGPLAGVQSALRAAKGDRSFVLTLPCDVPFLPSDLGPRLEEAIGTHGVAMAATGAQLHPTCALWRVEALDQLSSYLARGRRSLTGFAEAISLARVDWPKAQFFNVNTLEDLRTAEQHISTDRQPGADGL